jgi:hypothetical protein
MPELSIAFKRSPRLPSSPRSPRERNAALLRKSSGKSHVIVVAYLLSVGALCRCVLLMSSSS